MRQGVSGTAAKKLEHINVPELKSVHSALQIVLKGKGYKRSAFPNRQHVSRDVPSKNGEWKG